MEEMKEFEKEKKRNWKWLLAIPILLVILIVIYLQYSQEFNIPTLETQTTTTTTQPSQSAIQVTGIELLSREVTEFPSKTEHRLEEKIRIVVKIESDNPVGFQMGIEKNGIYNHKAGNLKEMKTVQNYKIDINEGESGLYHFKFATNENNPATHARFSITELAKL